MNKKKSLILVVGVVVVLAIVFCIISIVTKPKKEEFSIDGIKLPDNKEILKDKKIDNVKISNVSLLTKNGVSTFKARVYNISSEDLNIKKLTVNFYIGDNVESVDALVNANISKDSFVYINVTSLEDISNVKKIEYVIE